MCPSHHGNMNQISDSVVMGNVVVGDHTEITYVTNTVDSGRVQCPSCGATGQITLYRCKTCRKKMCDSCRNGTSCKTCHLKSENRKLIIQLSCIGVFLVGFLIWFVSSV